MNAVIPSPRGYERAILEHYKSEAASQGTEPSSTMRDHITREREVSATLRALEHVAALPVPAREVLEIGCGNGHLLEVIRRRWPALALRGLEYTPEMVDLARGRDLPHCVVDEGDVRRLPYPDASFDVVISERCIVNVMDRADQEKSLRGVARVLRPGGHFICIEAFTDGLAELNVAREELGLAPNHPPDHNLWFDKEWFRRTTEPLFASVNDGVGPDGPVPPPNFLSSHYFVSRALYPAVTRTDVRYNTRLVSFLSFLPPMGNYAPIQFHLLRRR
jgi:ubiquinone/menaquinone biosynthesis C-methylase UbiE